MKFGVVLDPHFSSTTPSSRVDDYSQSMLDKLSAVAKYANESGYTAVLFAGDIFHIKVVSWSYMNALIRTFRQFKQPCYTIGGNHDFYYNRADTTDRTPYGNILASGALRHLDYEEFMEVPPVAVTGVDFSSTPVIPPPRHPDYFNILVAHAFYGEGHFSEEYLKSSQVQGYQVVVLGHDHVPYEPFQDGTAVIVRPGSLSRGTQHATNLVRPVYFAEIDTAGPNLVTYREVSVLPADKVFLPQQVNRKEVKHDVDDFVKGLETVVFVNKGQTVETSLNRVCQDPAVKERTRQHLKAHAVI